MTALIVLLLFSTVFNYFLFVSWLDRRETKERIEKHYKDSIGILQIELASEIEKVETIKEQIKNVKKAKPDDIDSLLDMLP